MAVYFSTQRSADLLVKFEQCIALGHGAGSITTWAKGTDGRYTHQKPPHKDKAYFQASVEKERLAFYIQPPKDHSVDRETYAYYHGHLIETFLRHFKNRFDEAVATARAVNGKPKTSV